MTSSITPGPLVRALRAAFDDGSVERGEQYFRQGRAHIARGGAQTVRAHVSGTDNYVVDIELRDDGIAVDCTCAYFQDARGPCKHLWAVFREADARGMLTGDGRRIVTQLITDPEDADEHGEHAGDVGAGAALERAASRTEPSNGFEGEREPEFDAVPWEEQFDRLTRDVDGPHAPGPAPWPEHRELYYLVSRRETVSRGRIVLDIFTRDQRTGGVPGKLKPLRFLVAQITQVPNELDRRILSILVGARDNGYGHISVLADPGQSRYVLPGSVAALLAPDLCATGRCLIDAVPGIAAGTPLRCETEAAWEVWLAVRPSEGHARYEVTAELRSNRTGERLAARATLLEGGLLLTEDTLAPAQTDAGRVWSELLDPARRILVPAEDIHRFLERLLSTPNLPRLDLPEELRYERVDVEPKPHIIVHRQRTQRAREPRFTATITFRYDDLEIGVDDPRSALVQPDRRRWIPRATQTEAAALARLQQLGVRRSWSFGPVAQFELQARRLSSAVRGLIEDQWIVEADGRQYRPARSLDLEVRSGIDWFELHGAVAFDSGNVSLPTLLQAMRKGESTVALDDGSLGLLPEEWLRRYSGIVRLGSAAGDHLRFDLQQVGVLDALLEVRPEVRVDETFARMRTLVLELQGVHPIDPPESFVGSLRQYQREGLGWFLFLQRFGFGGCLADDMGLGKTVQVLALLERRRVERAALRAEGGEALPPSIVVVPKSLVFNWREEAARFAPELRVIEHTGSDRARELSDLDDVDLVITTYGTLRRDVALLRPFTFDYVILDEAQAIKNPQTEAAKAARQLTARHRLALSGTPIENHLGELWSLFEFLNPGLLGTISALGMNGVSLRMADSETIRVLGHVLRPFILRRTKAQVASDLPVKLEQTLHCELSPEERREYEELREHFRRALLGAIEEKGLGSTKIQILEALLRLRQAACHPGLIDPRRRRGSSAKLDLLRERLGEVIEGGSKALVFSQFTSFLDIVRNDLDHARIPYEYLDGRTRDRAERVERFQTDPECRVFLISLKAGGVGLNLTAAEYVFLLDPWWNPAVEAQAIDRTHRIGQERPVFAYRLIAADTIEQKVLDLQSSKRQLADAIIAADGGAIRDLTREDLELLLG